MTAQVPTREPDRLSAATTWTWRRDDLGIYPAPTWTLRYQFTNAAANFTFDAAADGSAFLVTRPVAETTTRAAGTYSWAARVTDGTSTYEVGRGTLVVLPSLSSGDARSHARKVLDAIEAVIEGRASRSDLSYTVSVGGSMRMLTTLKPDELASFRNQYRAEVRAEEERERIAQGRPGRRRILTRFTRPG